MTDRWLVDSLRPVPALAGLSDDDIAWLAARMIVVGAESGEMLVRPGEPADMLVVLLEGELTLELDHVPFAAVHVLGPGDVTGALPYSRLESYQLSVRATQPSRVACLRKEWFPDLLRRFPTLAQWLVSAMADRIRLMTTIHERQRRLAVLGKLSSVLAYELSAPATTSRDAARGLLDELRVAAEHARRPNGQGAADERAALGSAEARLDEIERAVTEISELVAAVKTYSYMDKEPVQEVDLHQGLDATLTLLRHYLKRGVTLVCEFDHTLPRVMAHGGELNLVWTSLLASVLQTMKGKGELRVRTARDGDHLLVAIGYSGPELPLDLRKQICGDVTATVSSETLLRLQNVPSIIQRHMGSIRLESRPSDTQIEVRLPPARTLRARPPAPQVTS